MTLEFELAQEKDLARIVEIYNQAIPTRMITADLEIATVEDKVAWFNSFNPVNRPIWIAIKDGLIVGWVSLENFYGRPAFIHTVEMSIYFDQAYTHQGFGQQALDFVFGKLPELDIDTVMVYIFSMNKPSLNLFKKNGFEEWANLPKIAQMDDERRSLKILGRRFSTKS